MNHDFALFRRFVRSVLLLLLAAGWMAGLAAGSVKIGRVEPPGWFTDLQMRSIQVLIQGEELGGCTVKAPAGSGLTVKVRESSANGHYLFLELTLGKKAKPGEYFFTLARGGESAKIPFRLRESCRKTYRPAGFSSRDTVYLIMPDRFADGEPANNIQPSNAAESGRQQPRGWHGGDLAGLTKHMDYFQTLGVNAVWLTPICENAGLISYHGYHATDFYRVDPHFGAFDELVRMVAAAHAKGLKVIQDQVVNHTGPDHPWVADPPAPDWFYGTVREHLSCDWNIPGVASPHTPASAKAVTTQGWFAGILPDLNVENPLLARYLIQNSIWWVAMTGIDGIRLDTYPYSPYSFWQQWFPPLRREFPQLSVVGEVMEWQPSHIAYWQKDFPKTGGTSEGPESLMDFCAGRAMTEVYRQPRGYLQLRDVYQLDYVYPAPTRLFTILDNHDTPRFATAIGSTGAACRNGLAVNLLLRGIPQIYSGGELAMEGGGDPDNRRDFPGGFSGDPVNAFTGEGLSADARACLDWTRRMLALRREHPALQSGTFIEVLAEPDILLVTKQAGTEEILLLFHRGSGNRDFTWENPSYRPRLDGTWKSLLDEESLTVTGGQFQCTLAPYGVKLWRRVE